MSTCRAEYQKALKKFIGKNIDRYCNTCKSRLEKNPMRILDCKEKICKELNQGAPAIIDYLCKECKEHFDSVKNMLTALGIKYVVDSGIVRGLDYYTKTVFEFIDEKEGYTVLAGGRYDGLVEELEGQPTPAIGFALGVERITEIFKRYIQPKLPQLYIATIGEGANVFATTLVENLRKNNLYVEKDVTGKSLKAQFKYADKIRAKYVITLGDTEIEQKSAKIKNMETGEEEIITLSIEAIVEYLK